MRGNGIYSSIWGYRYNFKNIKQYFKEYYLYLKSLLIITESTEYLNCTYSKLNNILILPLPSTYID